MSNKKILTVEDSNILRLLYQEKLGKHYNVETLEKGAHAVSAILSSKPDLVILDIHLPDISGINICERLTELEETRNIPIIMVTSDTSVETLKMAFKAGALDYLKKPFNEVELLIRVQNLLKLTESYGENVRLRENAAVETMGHSVAHHISQPLTTILGAAEMLEIYKRDNNTDLNELIDMIIKASQKLAQIVQKIENTKEYKTEVYLDDIRIINFD